MANKVNKMIIPHYFKLARKYARKSEFRRVHVGCVAVYKNSVIAYGINSYKTSPIQMRYNTFRNFGTDDTLHSIHSELHCLRKIRYLDIDWNKLHIYIYREKCDKSIGLARPCEACLAMIRDMGIKHIHYTSDNGFCYEKLI